MAERTRYLLAYDVRDPRRLRRVHQVAKDFGYALQYSVFVCDLTKEELLHLKARLTAEMNTAADSIGLFDLGPPRGRGVECVEFLGVRRPVPPTDEAAIW
ncbi:MAG TPA: CRISPR-associated endonuclease Cas2 [Capillimicrobium sp.]|nr:CRISPR-associated endonuclease Cas2 [Capillimicrobium sp.]